jgi:membrane associated rhomboid family serine protease
VTPVVRALLMANVGMFFLQTMLPGVENFLLFFPPFALYRPWTIVTYMFLHGNLMHILFNMLSLWFFGPRVESRIGSRRFTTLYFISGIAGALLSFVFSFASPILGASAGVFGVMMGFAYFWPEVPIMIWGIIPVPARWLVIFTTLIAFWSGFGGGGGNIAHFAHLGGYAGAYLYLKWLDRKKGEFRRKVTAAPPEAAQRVAGWRAVDVSKIHEVNRDQVNRILDKISAQGIDSLTSEERVFLSNFVPPDDRVPPVS